MRKFFTCRLFTTVFTLITLAGCTGSETLPTQPGTYLNDLWEYDGTSWKPIPPAATDIPSPRRDHTAVFDTTSTMYVFGGFNGMYLGDLWTFTFGGDWSEIPTADGDTPPSARRGHSAVWYSGKMYIFGGFNGTLLNDLWEYNPTNTNDPWTQISPAADAQPPYRRYHSAIVYSNKMYIFGGDNGAYQNELWEYDFDSQSWTQKAPNSDLPARRNGHSAVVSGNLMYVFGGGTFNGVLNDIWVYNLINNTWTPQSPTGTLPTARGVHSAVMLSGQMVVFGGYDTAASDETWQYNLTNTWTPKSSGPPARYAHSAVVNTNTNIMYVFGGYGPPTQ